jgi:hypothetical protein
MYLGSKGRICTVEPDPVRKREPGFQGEVEVEHGDIVVVRTFEAELDLGLKPEGFGFCKSPFKSLDRRLVLTLRQSASPVKSILRQARLEKAPVIRSRL